MNDDVLTDDDVANAEDRMHQAAPSEDRESLRTALVEALKEAATEEAAVWASAKRPVVGTWDDRILAAFDRHGIIVLRAAQRAARETHVHNTATCSLCAALLAASPAKVSESEPRWGDGDAGEAAVLADWDAEQAELAFHQRVCLLDRAKCFADGEPWPCTYVRAHPTPPAASTLRPENGLREAVKAEIAALGQSDGLHQYDKGIHRMPGCAACELRARLRAALTEPDAEETT